MIYLYSIVNPNLHIFEGGESLVAFVTDEFLCIRWFALVQGLYVLLQPCQEI